MVLVEFWTDAESYLPKIPCLNSLLRSFDTVISN